MIIDEKTIKYTKIDTNSEYNYYKFSLIYAGLYKGIPILLDKGIQSTGYLFVSCPPFVLLFITFDTV